MRVETYACLECGTIVAGNVLERERRLRCPGRDCENVLSFEDLPADARDHYRTHRDRYRTE